MDQCEFIETCVFAVNNADSALRETYCNSNSLHCARFMVYQALGVDKAPDDLMPDDKTSAYTLLAEN